ncbi:unnamed protein product [Onchocerca flexuosa]|uniref:Uncharacterized protein n=1 Tax=Onchocerca flexuosa TaxID=387005 RepID=A0A183H263_9BILA|nr:unnamed protein product [Onchocerca flexuosa]
MSNVDLQERLSRHRGFTTKAREVLLEPPAPFAVVAESSGSLSNESTNPKAPHRGFTAKAREMLVERQNSHHGSKCKFPDYIILLRLDFFFEQMRNLIYAFLTIRTDFDIFRKRQSQLNYLALDELPIQQANIGMNIFPVLYFNSNKDSDYSIYFYHLENCWLLKTFF